MSLNVEDGMGRDPAESTSLFHQVNLSLEGRIRESLLFSSVRIRGGAYKVQVGSTRIRFLLEEEGDYSFTPYISVGCKYMSRVFACATCISAYRFLCISMPFKVVEVECKYKVNVRQTLS
jgi:hypothetical protein